MANTTRYTLWLMPDDTSMAQLQAVIDQLGGRYQGPQFAPHVTLLGWVRGDEDELKEKTGKLAASLPTLPVTINGLAGAPYYFRCFFARLQDNDGIKHATTQAIGIFKIKPTSDFLPHISLLYGQLDRDEKKTIPEQVGDKIPRNLTLDKLRLVRMSVSVSGWETVAEVPLSGS